eukprot:3929910-Pleurochrysis_carterae.AAC.5
MPNACLAPATDFRAADGLYQTHAKLGYRLLSPVSTVFASAPVLFSRACPLSSHAVRGRSSNGHVLLWACAGERGRTSRTLRRHTCQVGQNARGSCHTLGAVELDTLVNGRL